MRSFVAFLAVTCLSFSAFKVDLPQKITEYFSAQGKVVTYSIQYQNLNKLQISSADTVTYPDSYAYGFNSLKLLRQERFIGNLDYVLEAQQQVPVCVGALKPGDKIVSQNLRLDWVRLDKVSTFVITDSSKIINSISRFNKKRDDFFQDTDLKEEPVIFNQQPCFINLRYKLIAITVPGTALKNGTIGSRIKVLNEKTKKILDAIVIDSHNVEVRLEI